MEVGTTYQHPKSNKLKNSQIFGISLLASSILMPASFPLLELDPDFDVYVKHTKIDKKTSFSEFIKTYIDDWGAHIKKKATKLFKKDSKISQKINNFNNKNVFIGTNIIASIALASCLTGIYAYINKKD